MHNSELLTQDQNDPLSNSPEKEIEQQNGNNWENNNQDEYGRIARLGWNFIKSHEKECINSLSIFMSIVTLLNYNELREQCPHLTDRQCLPFILNRLRRWIALIIFNSLFMSLQVILFLKRKGSNAILLFGTSQIFYLLIYSDQTISVRYYIGAINLVHVAIIITFLSTYFTVLLLKKLYEKNRKRCLSISAAIIIVFTIYAAVRINTSCQKWDQGITGSIQTLPGGCKLKIPTYCWYTVVNGLFDATILLHDCHFSSSARRHFNKYFENALTEGPFIGLMNTNFLTEQQRHQQIFQRQIFTFAKGFPSLQEAQKHKNNYDMIFDSENQKYHINVRRNQTLIEERKVLWQAANKLQSPPLAKNILLIYEDAISRASMHLKLPKILKFFQKRAKKNSYSIIQSKKPADANQDEAYQFYRYNAYFPWTSPNQMRMFYGYCLEQLNLMKKPNQPLRESNLKPFQKKGYILGTSNSFCSTASMSYDGSMNQLVESLRFDHEIYSYACDPNFMNPQNTLSVFQGPYSMDRHCLYDRTMAQYTIDAAKSFFKAYKDVPKLYMMQFEEGHEGTGEVISYTDEPIAKFLEHLQAEQMLQDTVVVLFSDHGLHMHGILQLVDPESVQLQVKLPGMLVSLPPKLNNIYREKIALNQQVIVTAFNFYHFLRHIAEGVNYQNRQKSLMGNLSSQTCQNMNITSQQCACKP